MGRCTPTAKPGQNTTTQRAHAGHRPHEQLTTATVLELQLQKCITAGLRHGCAAGSKINVKRGVHLASYCNTAAKHLPGLSAISTMGPLVVIRLSSSTVTSPLMVQYCLMYVKHVYQADCSGTCCGLTNLANKTDHRCSYLQLPASTY